MIFAAKYSTSVTKKFFIDFSREKKKLFFVMFADQKASPHTRYMYMAVGRLAHWLVGLLVAVLYKAIQHGSYINSMAT